jgi:hypothetical protein
MKWKNALNEGQTEALRPVAFRPHLTMGLAFYRRGFKLPTGKLCLLGAGHIYFEVFFHWVTSWIEVEWLVRIPANDETIKNPLCQEKSVFRQASRLMIQTSDPIEDYHIKATKRESEAYIDGEQEV